MRRRALWLAAGGWLATGAAAAQTVQMAGRMGRKALLVVDGQTVTLAVGETRAGVTLHALDGNAAEVGYGGQRHALSVGGAPARLAGDRGERPSGRSIVINAGPGGHFMAAGTINNRPVQFMVDTGATTVALGADEADRIGLDYRSGQRARLQTAGGPVVGHVLTLSAVTVGDVTLANVAAVVMPAPMPYVLLGNSFLSRFQMRRDNDQMRLDLR
jgi:aspartyl protease family protein